MSFSTRASHFLQFPYMPSREASTYLRQMKRSFQKQWTTLPLSISASLPRVIARVGARHKLSLTSSVRMSSRHPPLARRTQYELARWQVGHGYHAFNRSRRYGPLLGDRQWRPVNWVLSGGRTFPRSNRFSDPPPVTPFKRQ